VILLLLTSGWKFFSSHLVIVLFFGTLPKVGTKAEKERKKPRLQRDD
jgi:hypothetical protein